MLIHDYDELLLPFVRRMLNLEKLDLNVEIHRRKGLVDAKELKEKIIDYMARLNKFTFNICSLRYVPVPVNILSNEEIERLFEKFPNDRIISCTNYFPEKKHSHCRIYSYPYRLKRYDYIANNFPGGLFHSVTEVFLYDERPFEHEFFIRIAQSFPFVKHLSVSNKKPQKNKLPNDNEGFPVIEYLHLIHIDLINVHDDYIEQFLIDRKMSLPKNVSLSADFESLRRVTENFRRDATRINCNKVKYTCFDYSCGYNSSNTPQHIKDYFLHVNFN